MALFEVKETKQVDVRFLQVTAGVRYWEDADVNGTPDEDGKLMPFVAGDVWRPLIDIDSGVIIDWPEGTTASVHYKVCDAGVYTLLSADRERVRQIEGYVPSILSPSGNGYGDYIIMEISGDGKIKNWKANLEAFEDDDE